MNLNRLFETVKRLEREVAELKRRLDERPVLTRIVEPVALTKEAEAILTGDAEHTLGRSRRRG